MLRHYPVFRLLHVCKHVLLIAEHAVVPVDYLRRVVDVIRQLLFEDRRYHIKIIPIIRYADHFPIGAVEIEIETADRPSVIEQFDRAAPECSARIRHLFQRQFQRERHARIIFNHIKLSARLVADLFYFAEPFDRRVADQTPFEQ